MPKTVRPQHPRTRTQIKPQPLLSLCVIFRNNRETLPALLKSIAGKFDELVFTDTGSTDGSRKLVEAAGAKVTDFAWTDDFAAARQACFEAATGQWRMFLDSDDVLENGDKLKTLVSILNQKHPNVKGVFVPYDYDIDESLGTMRLCKWSKEWRWADAIHERLEWVAPSGEVGLGQESFARTSEITVRHKRKTPEEKTAAIARNAAIALREYPKAEGQYRARLARTIAMEMKLNGLVDEAVPYLEEVYAGYPNFPEGRQAAADLCKAFIVSEKHDLALAWGKKAGPSYEALAHHARGEWRQVIQRQTRGQVIPQQTTHEGFIFEKAAAPVAVADAAERLGFPVAGVEQALNTVRADLREHPMLVGTTNRIRDAIDRITIMVPGTPQPFDSTSGDTMLGGSEEAVVYLTRALAQAGRNVRVFTPLPATTVPGLDEHGVEWQDVATFKHTDEHGHLVVWRSGHFAADLLGRIQANQKRIDAGDKEGVVPFTGITGSSFWLHDRAIGLPPAVGFAVCRAFDSVVVLSEHHKRCIIKDLGGQDPGNLVVLSNGIVAEQFAGLADVEKDPNLVVYSSCASRGLRVLLDMWPKVKAACPEARLEIRYDWNMLRDAQPDLYADIVAKYEAVRSLDVNHGGGVGHAELNELLSRANVWAYAHFENTDVETFCIGSVKATAAGCTVLTTEAGALPEVVPEAHFSPDPAAYLADLIDYLKDPTPLAPRQSDAALALARFSWDAVAKRFSDLWRRQA